MTAKPRTVALMGGSFNPPHVGHLMAALYVRLCLNDDEVWFVPTFQHPFGKATVAYEHRVRMCEIAAENTGPWLKVSTAESAVPSQSGRTIDLLESLLPSHPDTRFRLVLGSDILSDLPKWKAWDRIQKMVEVTVLYRAGFPAQGTVGPPLIAVSSSEVRANLDGALVPSCVLEYIRQNRLFGA